LRVGRKIRVPNVRLIDKDGGQVGVVTIQEALSMADAAGLDLVEVVPTANPPVCKIIDFGKFRYEQAKKEKESRRSHHQMKIKEVKVKPMTDDHDLQVKIKHAREFIQKGDKVRITCMFRGRQMQHPEFGRKVVERICEELADIASPESPPKQMGRNLSVTIAPGVKKKPKEKRSVQNEEQKSDERPL
jgi:translation initiation factor IF-3